MRKGQDREPDPEDPSDNSEDEADIDANVMEQQDPAERRAIRKRYRDMIQATNQNRHDFLNPRSNRLQDTLNDANETFQDVRQCREAVLDAHLVASLSSLGRQRAQELNTDSMVFSPADFVEKLAAYLGDDKQQGERKLHISVKGWENLGRSIQPYFKRSPPLHFMYGSFERGPPKQKPVVARPKNVPDKDANKGPSAPKVVSNFKDMAQQETTTAEVENIHHIMEAAYRDAGRKPLCYFAFVINPHSFGQTIENVFYVAFLVRDGYVRMMLDNDKLPVIEPVEDRDGDQPSSLPHHQVIMSITKPEWREIIETFGLDEPMIPTRSALTSIENCSEEVTVQGKGKNGKNSRQKSSGKKLPAAASTASSSSEDEEREVVKKHRRGNKSGRR